MANDVSDRDDRAQVPSGQAPAVERIIARHFEDDQNDAPTITPSAESLRLLNRSPNGID